MPHLRPQRGTSRGRRFKIKRIIFFPLIIYLAYMFTDSLMPLFLIGFVV